eukprot:scaffold442_cov397-Prasinococcus_capsulatus_cf.AAC.34
MADPVRRYEVVRLVKVGQQLRLALCLAQLVYHGSGVLHVHNGDNTPSITRSGPATHAARSASTHLRDRKRLHASRLVWNASDSTYCGRKWSQGPLGLKSPALTRLSSASHSRNDKSASR